MKWKLPQPAKAKRRRKDAWEGSPIHVGVLGFCGFVLRVCSGSLFHFGARSDQRRKGRPSFWYIPNRVHRSGRLVGQSIRSTKIREFLAQGNPEAIETRDTCKTYARRSRNLHLPWYNINQIKATGIKHYQASGPFGQIDGLHWQVISEPN